MAHSGPRVNDPVTSSTKTSISGQRESGTDFCAVLVLDPSGRISHANDSARKLWQTGEKELLGEAFASLFAFGMALLTWRPPMNGFYNPGVILGVVFGVTAVVVFALSFRVQADSWWRDVAGLDDETLKSVGFRNRR